VSGRKGARDDARHWTFLTNHAHVLLCLAADPEMRVRDLAERVQITERAVQRLLADLETAGYIVRTRSGRRTRYELDLSRPMRHPVEHTKLVSSLVNALGSGEDDGQSRSSTDEEMPTITHASPDFS
jgi:predicted ArsR family transcriptional regulator